MEPSKAELAFEAYNAAAYGDTLKAGAERAGVDLDWHWIRRSPEAVIVEWESQSEAAMLAWAVVADLPGQPSAEACYLTFARSWPELFGDNPRWVPEAQPWKAAGWRAVAAFLAGRGDEREGET